jgi:hypothetical protein
MEYFHIGGVMGWGNKTIDKKMTKNKNSPVGRISETMLKYTH